MSRGRVVDEAVGRLIRPPRVAHDNVRLGVGRRSVVHDDDLGSRSAAGEPGAQVLVEVCDRDGVGELGVTVSGLAKVFLRAVQEEKAGMRPAGLPGDLEDRKDPRERDQGSAAGGG